MNVWQAKRGGESNFWRPCEILVVGNKEDRVKWLFGALIVTSMETLHPLYWSLLTLTFEGGTDNLEPCIINLYCKLLRILIYMLVCSGRFPILRLFTKFSSVSSLLPYWISLDRVNIWSHQFFYGLKYIPLHGYERMMNVTFYNLLLLISLFFC